MELADILAPSAVNAFEGVPSKRQLFSMMGDTAAQVTGLHKDDIVEAINSREALGSTGVGNGIAIPHGKLAGLKTVTAIFARVGEPLPFDAVDDQPVDVVMMLLAPIGGGADHLKALSRVARLLRTEAVLDGIRSTQDPDALYALLTTPLEAPRAA